MLYHTIDPVFPRFRDLATTHGRLIDLGYIAVSFFFTLSGYILAVSYLPRSVPKKKFWRARFARVYPLFFFTLFLDTPSYFIGLVKQFGAHAATRITFKVLSENILLLQAWVPAFRGMNFPSWSLSVEAFFYFLCPFVLAVIARFSLASLAFYGVASYIVGLVGVAAAMHAHASLDVLKFHPLFHLHSFICGALLGASRFKFQLSSKYAPALLAVSLLGFTAIVHYYLSIPLPFIHDGLLVPAFSCAILAFDCDHRGLTTLLSSKTLVLLGEASYAIYVLHTPLWHIVFRLKLIHSQVAFFCYLISLIGLSIFCFIFVETPLRLALTGNRKVKAIQPREAASGARVSDARSEPSWVTSQPDIDAAPQQVPLISKRDSKCLP